MRPVTCPALPRTPRAQGFTLVECLVTCTVVAVLATLSWPSFRGQELRAGRLDAVEALTRVQQAQERYRSAHGLYAPSLGPLQGTGAQSPQGRYAISIAVDGPEAYQATASAQGSQARDADCTTLTLQVRLGFAQQGPQAHCWLR